MAVKLNMKSPALLCALTCLALLSGSSPALGQQRKGTWYGSAEASAGTNFNKSGMNLYTATDYDKYSRTASDLKLNVGWKKDKWDVSLNAGAKSSYVRTDFEGASYKSENRDTTYNIDFSQTEKSISNFNVGTNVTYRPGNNDVLHFSFKHEQEHQKPSHIIYSIKIRDDLGIQGTDEHGNYLKMTFEPKFTWDHNFDKKGRMLKLSLGWFYANDDRNTIWDKGNLKMENPLEESGQLDTVSHSYRLTPVYKDSDFNASLNYSDTDFAGVENLNTTFFLKNTISTDVDVYAGANLKDGEWVDSTRLMEKFNYLTILAEPGAKAQYRIGQFSFDYSLSLQYFTDRLNNPGSGQKEKLDLGRVDPVITLKNWWEPSSGNKVGLHYTREIKRPDYLQLCWFQRPGVLSNEIREGNADLRPTVTNRIYADYKFTLSKFTAGVEIGLKSVTDQIEQTFYQQDIEGTSYRIYTYVNAGHSYTGNIKLSTGWSGRIFKGNLEANLNNFLGLNSKGGETRSNDLSVKADADCSLPWKIRLQAAARYQSKITRIYRSMSSYVGCDLKLSRIFGKFTVYLEGKDLFDKNVELETYSEDFSSGRIESTRNNRRVFRVGVTVKI